MEGPTGCSLLRDMEAGSGMSPSGPGGYPPLNESMLKSNFSIKPEMGSLKPKV